MKVQKTTLDGVLLLKPPTIFEDFRGSYVETFNERLYKENGVTCSFVQDDISVSSRGVLRGVHGDQTTWKLISCLYGKFYLVVVNWNSTSSQYKQWEAFTLSDENRLQVLVPPKFGNGHLVMSEQAIFHYKQSTYYDRGAQFTIPWNDPEVRIWWPTQQPIVSARDQGIVHV
jgi:dTDP-4-dehydrorhamnose 3,5-epimerase